MYQLWNLRQPNDQEDSEESEYEDTITDDLLSLNPNPSTSDIEKSPPESENFSSNNQDPVASNLTSDVVEEPTKIIEDILSGKKPKPIRNR